MLKLVGYDSDGKWDSRFLRSASTGNFPLRHSHSREAHAAGLSLAAGLGEAPAVPDGATGVGPGEGTVLGIVLEGSQKKHPP